MHALEKSLAIGILTTPGFEGEVINMLRSCLVNPEGGTFAALWTDETDERGLFRRWRTSHLSQELEHHLPSLERLPAKE